MHDIQQTLDNVDEKFNTLRPREKSALAVQMFKRNDQGGYELDKSQCNSKAMYNAVDKATRDNDKVAIPKGRDLVNLVKTMEGTLETIASGKNKTPIQQAVQEGVTKEVCKKMIGNVTKVANVARERENTQPAPAEPTTEKPTTEVPLTQAQKKFANRMQGGEHGGHHTRDAEHDSVTLEKFAENLQAADGKPAEYAQKLQMAQAQETPGPAATQLAKNTERAPQTGPAV